MLDLPLSADQIRNAAGVTFAEAQLAAYMASASDTWTLADFEEKTGLSRAACRAEAFRWGVQFPDYNPFAKPKRLEFRKAKVGWGLLDGEDEIGECCRDSKTGKYVARLFSQLSVENWDARRAMSELARKVDELSPDLMGFDGLPVKVVEVTEHGLVAEILFGDPDTDEVHRCRTALDYRATRKAA